ncbi:hypothetical protein FORMB_03200 [Formosa sp. Hel1_33_131]|uniref:hypothetical protein n=1 Tax=Formosa sp. Hel1_33_131 TaxID=1336794 RepID=UPI00084E2A16|nr:hypothetical protein [Formosa sp. Hel1_33_131]AOR27381.1 hypothetical protein FORMB_03200 [Formosa sp. Hel1_33_131]
MEYLNKVELKGEKLNKIPLHFRKIYYNQITFIHDELKMIKYNSFLQCDNMRDYYPNRQISKTINFKTFNNDE